MWHIIIMYDFKYNDTTEPRGEYKYQVWNKLQRLGVVAYSCNPATWRPVVEGDYTGLKTKLILFYLKTQSVPRCKHFSSRL